MKKIKLSPKQIVGLSAAGAALIALLCLYLSFTLVWTGALPKFIPTSAREVSLRGEDISGLAGLNRCRHLEYLDLRGATFSEDQCAALQDALPDCVIERTVTIGGVSFDSSDTSIVLPDADESEFEKLRYFHSLEHVDANACTYSDALLYWSGRMPDCTFDWTVDICGKRIPSSADSLDLTDCELDIDELCRLAHALPNLAAVDIREHFLGADAISRIKSELSGCNIIFTTSAYGIRIDSDMEEIDLSGTKISDTSELEAALGVLEHPKKIVMCDCGLTNAQMEQLCDRFTDMRFVWRVRIGIWSLRTDATYFCTNINSQDTPRLHNSDIVPLKYCTDLEHLDIGHNPVTDLSPLAGLTKLRTLIVIGSTVKDISPLAGMTDMEYLELFINDISDLTPLSGMHKLLDLNLCYNDISDVTPLLGLTQLERLWISQNLLDEADQQALRDALPNCEFNFTALASTGGGWRRHERYFKMRENFGYSPDREKYGF